jgi:hypothetical protein
MTYRVVNADNENEDKEACAYRGIRLLNSGNEDL